MLFVLSAPVTPVDAEGSIPINWEIVGTIVQFIDVTPPTGPPAEPKSLINLSAQGSPSSANITLLSKTEGTPTTPNGDCTEKGYTDLAYNFEKNDSIAIFPDQSLLFASINDAGGYLCFNLSEGESYFKVNMDITGGKGRFEGASGDFSATGNGYFINPTSDNTLVGENGRITGTIDLP